MIKIYSITLTKGKLNKYSSHNVGNLDNYHDQYNKVKN